MAEAKSCQTSTSRCRCIGQVVLLAVALFLGVIGSLSADDFSEGNALFEKGKFAEAKQYYEKLVESGQGTANVYYNLGNADYRLGLTGRAILNYERALALSPNHPEALNNRKFLRAQSKAKLPPSQWYFDFFGRWPVNVWIIAASVAAWIALFCLASIATSKRAQKVGAWILCVCGLLTLSVSAVGTWLGIKDQALGIITAQEAESRLAPAVTMGVVEKLPAGSRVRILNVRGAWAYCELPGSSRGWVPSEMVERVRPARS